MLIYLETLIVFKDNSLAIEIKQQKSNNPFSVYVYIIICCINTILCLYLQHGSQENLQ